jgi:hypothetical protein
VKKVDRSELGLRRLAPRVGIEAEFVVPGLEADVVAAQRPAHGRWRDEVPERKHAPDQRLVHSNQSGFLFQLTQRGTLHGEMVRHCEGQTAHTPGHRSIPVNSPRSRLATSRRSSSSFAKRSRPTTLVVQASARKHFEAVPMRAMVMREAARHGRVGPGRSLAIGVVVLGLANFVFFSSCGSAALKLAAHAKHEAASWHFRHTV